MNLLVHQCFISFSIFLHTGVCELQLLAFHEHEKKNLLLVYLSPSPSLSLSRNLESKSFFRVKICWGVRKIRE